MFLLEIVLFGCRGYFMRGITLLLAGNWSRLCDGIVAIAAIMAAILYAVIEKNTIAFMVCFPGIGKSNEDQDFFVMFIKCYD